MEVTKNAKLNNEKEISFTTNNFKNIPNDELSTSNKGPSENSAQKRSEKHETQLETISKGDEVKSQTNSEKQILKLEN